MYFFPLISYSLVEVGAELNSAHICIIVFPVIFPSKFYCRYKYSVFIIFFLSPVSGVDRYVRNFIICRRKRSFNPCFTFLMGRLRRGQPLLNFTLK